MQEQEQEQETGDRRQEEGTTDHTDATDEEGQKGEPRGWQSRTTDDGRKGHGDSRMNGKSSCQRCEKYLVHPGDAYGELKK